MVLEALRASEQQAASLLPVATAYCGMSSPSLFGILPFNGFRVLVRSNRDTGALRARIACFGWGNR
eukprot:9895335-Alexandrium_andersonii.AAC.1